MMDQIKGELNDKEAATRMALNKIQWRRSQIAEQIFHIWEKEKEKLLWTNRSEFSFQMSQFGFAAYITFLHILCFKRFY